MTFNSRPHEEVDVFPSYVCDTAGCFQFTTSRGGRQLRKRWRNTVRSFQFTTSRGGRLTTYGYAYLGGHLSIHDLTRRSTSHSPQPAPRHQNFQFTTSRGGRRKILQKREVLLIFQFTTSRGGRRSARLLRTRTEYLSIHDLTRRSTSASIIRGGIPIFQFTTSRGGRHVEKYLVSLPSPFNSRPHEEVDRYEPVTCCIICPFNSRPHEEVDVSLGISEIYCKTFNSRPHEEVDAWS